MKKTFLFSLFFLCSFILSLQAQTGKISGVIIDSESEEPLIGANIFIDNLHRGVITSENGEFIFPDLEERTTYTLKISFLGYHTQMRKVICNKNQAVRILLEPETTNLDELIITAKSEARKIREDAMPISVISMKEIQGSVSDVNELLSRTMGVQLRNTGGVGSASRISLRGLEGKRIGYFIDETPMNDNSDFMDLNDIPIDLIERIEVYKGIVPAKLGGSAIGGAVNIVLKEYPPSYYDIAYTFASFNTHKSSVVLKNNKNDYEFGVGGFYTYSDNNYEMELPLRKGTFIKRNHDRFVKKTLGGGITAKNNKWWFDEVEIEPSLTRSSKEIQGIEFNIQEAENFNTAFFLGTKAEKEDFIWNGLDFDLDILYSYTIFEFEDKAKQSYKWDGTPIPANTKFGGEIDSPNDLKNIKHSFVNTLNFNYLLNSWSSINLNSTFNYVKGLPTDTLKDKAIGYKTAFNSDMYSWVIGLNYEMRFWEDLFMNSFTLKHYLYDMQTKLTGLYDKGKIIDVDNHKSSWGVNNAIRYRFNSDLLLKSSIAYDVRLPSETELLGDGFLLAPSGNLTPERSTNFNLGLFLNRNVSSGKFNFEMNVFYTYLENMIRIVGGPLQSNYTNFGEMRTIGGEVEVKWDVTSYMYIYGNTTYQDLRDVRKYDPSGDKKANPHKGDRMPNIPYFFANGGLEFHHQNLFGGVGQNSRLFINTSFIEEYFYDFEESKRQTKRIPRTTTLNIGLEHSFRKQSVILGFQCNNVTGETIVSEFNRPLPGRNFALKLRYIFKSNK